MLKLLEINFAQSRRMASRRETISLLRASSSGIITCTTDECSRLPIKLAIRQGRIRHFAECLAAQSTANLGQIGRGDMVPEFEQALFRLGPTGILREVIKTRYGFHLVAVDQRIPGETLPFEVVREQIAELLKASVEERALRQYVSILAGQAELTGVDLQTVDSPLVQ